MRVRTMILTAALLLHLVPIVRAADEQPAGPGDSRVADFFLPGQFLEARMKAMETNRSLLIKGVAFGMDEAGAKCATKGHW